MDFLEEKKDEFGHKVYITLLKTLSMLAILSIIGNMSYGLPFALNFKWGTLLVINIISIYFMKRDQYIFLLKTLFISIITFVFIPLSWFESGGSSNSIIAYFVLLMICTTFLYWGKTRIFFVISQIAIFITLHIVEYKYPNLIQKFDAQTLFIDKLFQIPLTLIAAFIFLRAFANAYISERKKLNFLVHHDSLTSLYNRRSFDIHLEKLLNSNIDANQEAYLIFMDLDNFKLINDEKGHHIGDKVLIDLADHIQKQIKEGDIAARWGGDEYAIIFHGTESALRSTLKDIHKFPYPISSGATKIRQDENDIIRLLKRADKAAYKSKSEGKGQFSIQ